MKWYDRSKLVGRFRKIDTVEKQMIFKFRDNPTEGENALWEIVRNKRLAGSKFRRQHKIGQFIVDFYCHSAGLVIEVDGSVHDNRSVEDSVRTKWLGSLGLKVVRFTNEEVISNPDRTTQTILAFLKVGNECPLRGTGGI